jgi:hypothetical protein
MKNRSLIVFVLLLFVFGCSKDSLKDPAVPQEDGIKEKIVLTPLTGYMADDIITVVPEKKGKIKTKTIKFHNSSGIMGALPNPGECQPYGGYFQAFIEGTGHATHLGLFDVINTYCIDDLGNPISPIYGIITAANGDQLFTQLTGLWYDEVLEMTFASYIVYDGSGRFDGATGDILMYGTIDNTTNTWDLEGEGTISY